MLSINIIKTLPIAPKSIYVQWTLQGATDVGIYIFDIFYGNGSNDESWDILGTVINEYHYVHNISSSSSSVSTPNLLSLNETFKYKVRCTPPSDSTLPVFAISEIEPRLDSRQKLLKRKVLRDQALALRKLNGIEIAVLKRMRWGTRCTICVDKYTKEVIRGNCTSCYGTTYVGGYHAPIKTLTRRGAANVQTQLTQQGKTDTLITSMMVLDAPVIHKDDIIVELGFNRRYLVQSVEETELRSILVYQKLIVSELARNAIEYRIEVDPYHTPSLF